MARASRVFIIKDHEGVWDVLIRSPNGVMDWHSEHRTKKEAEIEAVKYGYVPPPPKTRVAAEDRHAVRTIRINDARWRILVAMGRGNASLGVRTLIDKFLADEPLTDETESNEIESSEHD